MSARRWMVWWRSEKYTGRPVPGKSSEHAATIYRGVVSRSVRTEKNRTAGLGLIDCERYDSCRGLIIIKGFDDSGFWVR